MKETVVNYLKSSLQGWDCPSDNTFYRQLTCGEALLTWTLTVEEDTLISHLVAEVPRQLVLPQSLAVTGLSWMCIGNSISQTARWDLSLLTPQRLVDKMGRMVALMGIAVAADSHVYEDVLPDFLPL